MIAQEDGRVRLLVSGVAKEGLIKQHADEKAARRVAGQLRAALPALDTA